MARRRLMLKRLGLLVATLVASGMVLYVVNVVFGLELDWKLYLLKNKLFGDPVVAISQPDDRFGWRLTPGATETVRTPDFTATYAIGSDGDRVVPGAPQTGLVVAFLGGSFTMGTGVSDHEAFPSILQRDYWKSYRIRNLGCKGYTTSHALLRLEEEFKAGRKIHLAVYGWIHHHLCRNDRRRSWLAGLARSGGKSPLYEFEDGKLAFKGTIGLDQAIDDDDSVLHQREWQVTRALVAALRTLCREHDAHFVVVMFPWGISAGTKGINHRLATTCQILGVPCLNLTKHRALLAPGSYYPRDKHPTPSWHRMAAHLIAQGLDVKTGRVRFPIVP